MIDFPFGPPPPRPTPLIRIVPWTACGVYPNEGKGGECPPEWDVNLFNVRAVARGVCGDVAVQWLFLGSASVFFLSCVSVCPHPVWWVGGERVSGQGPDQTIQESEIYKK